MEFLFLLIGLGFFLFVINLCTQSEREAYNRKLNEQREFGYHKQKRRDRKEFLNDQ